MKNAIYLLLFVTTFFTLHSCSEDDYLSKAESQKESYNSYKRSIVSFDDMRTQLSSSSGEVLSLFNNIANKGGGEYIQEIDTTHIIQYTNDTLTTYTMRVVTLDEDNYSYSNLLIKSLNGETEEVVVHYKPTNEWQEAHDTGDYLPYDGLLDVTDIYGTSLDEDPNVQGRGKITCSYSIEIIYVGGNCDSCPKNVVSSYILHVECSSDGGGNNPYGGDGGGPFNENGEGNLPTDPVGGGGGNTQYGAFNKEFLNGGILTTSQINWLNAHPTILSQIENYLNQYGQPNDPMGWYDNYNAVLFAQWAVGYLMNNPNYNFNDLLWIQNLGFSAAEKSHIMTNSALVKKSTDLMKLHTAVDMDTRKSIIGLNVAFELAYATNTLHLLSQSPAYNYFLNKLTNFLSSPVYHGVAYVYSLMHGLYWAVSEITDANKINACNLFLIDPIRNLVANGNYVNTNLNTMSWKDVLLIWLFELGDYPTLHQGHPTLAFGSNANVVKGTANIDGIKNHNNGNGSVEVARQDVKGLISGGQQNGNKLYFWQFNTQVLSNFILNPNYMEFTLGSYNTRINWAPGMVNNMYNFTFSISNITGWNSATRGLNGTFVIPDKPRGNGIHLGGTIAETFVWTETYTP